MELGTRVPVSWQREVLAKGAAHMNQGSVEDHASATAREIDRDKYKLWYEKPAGKFCLGFSVFVIAEVLVYGTLHWIFPLI